MTYTFRIIGHHSRSNWLLLAIRTLQHQTCSQAIVLNLEILAARLSENLQSSVTVLWCAVRKVKFPMSADNLWLVSNSLRQKVATQLGSTASPASEGVPGRKQHPLPSDFLVMIWVMSNKDIICYFWYTIFRIGNDWKMEMIGFPFLDAWWGGFICHWFADSSR